MTPTPAPDALAACADLAALGALFPGLEGKKLLHAARQAWGAHALAAAQEVEAPARLEPVSCSFEGRTVAIYGVMHGLVGGDAKAYKSFVDSAIAELPGLVFENGLQLFYRGRGPVIPDFAALGPLGSLWLGLLVALRLPLLLFELGRELLKPRRQADRYLAYDARYHALDPELRRGLDPEPVLPARLEIAATFAARARRPLWSRLADPFAIVPRSLFMAGYAAGCGRDVQLVVGDLHTTEIATFLDGGWSEHPLFLRGRRWARAGKLRFLLAKLTHLGLAGLGGSVLLIPLFLALRAWLLPA